MNKYDPLPGKTARGVRTATLVMLGMGVQGTFLARAIWDEPTLSSWMLWLAVFLILLVSFIYNGIRNARLNRLEQAEWDKKFEEQKGATRSSPTGSSSKVLGTSLPED